MPNIWPSILFPPRPSKLSKDNNSDSVRFLDLVISFNETVIQVSPVSWFLSSSRSFPTSRQASLFKVHSPHACLLYTLQRSLPTSPAFLCAAHLSAASQAPTGTSAPAARLLWGLLITWTDFRQVRTFSTSLKNVSLREARPDFLSTSGSIVICCHRAFCFLSRDIMWLTYLLNTMPGTK